MKEQMNWCVLVAGSRWTISLTNTARSRCFFFFLREELLMAIDLLKMVWGFPMKTLNK